MVRNGVATINRVTKSAQADVVHKAWIGQDNYGEPNYADQSLGSDGGPLKAVVELKQSLRALPNGTTVLTKARVTFTEPVPVNGTAGRTEPIDPRDLIVLPNGITGSIVDIVGTVDPETSEPYTVEVWLGA